MGVDQSHSVLVRWLARVCPENQRDSAGRSGSQLLGQSLGQNPGHAAGPDLSHLKLPTVLGGTV